MRPETMRSTDALFKPDGDFYSHPKPVIFRRDQVLTYFDTDLGLWNDLTDVGPGQFVLVLYGVGDVGGGYTAANKLYAFALVLDEAVKLPSGRRHDVVDALLLTAGDSVPLSEGQRSALISHIKRKSRYWWDNASREVKEVLSGGADIADRARGLLREAIAVWDGSEEQERAMRLIREALALDSALGHAHMQLAKMAIARGDVPEAIRQCEAELSEAGEPNALDAHSYLSLIYEGSGHGEASRRHAHAAMTAQTGVPTPLLPEVAEKIRLAGHRERTNSPSGHVSAGATVRVPKWWEFWKK